MESERKDFAMEKLMSEIIKRIDQMEKDNITGQMVIIIKEIFQMVYVMEMVILSKENPHYSIEGNIKMIRSVDLDK